MYLKKLACLALILTLILTSVSGCQCPPVPSANMVNINEVMFNPFGEDAGEEWIELYNGMKARDIKEWTISNHSGDIIATLPDWTFPPDSYLQIVFGAGVDDSDFTDGAGVFHTQGNLEVLNNTEDEVALYAGRPASSNILDFVSWCSDGDYEPGEAHSHAVKAEQWTAGSFLDIGFPSGQSVLGGISIGRDGNSADTDFPDDWERNGGANAYFDTPGKKNSAPRFTTDQGIILTQAQANLLLIQWGHQVIHASHEVIFEHQTAEESYIEARHSFTTTFAGHEDVYTGIGEYRWTRLNPQEWREEIDIEFARSISGENYSIHYTRLYEDTGLSQTTIENSESIYSFEILDSPVPEAPTHTEEKSISSSTITTITQVALDEYREETTSDVDLAYLGEKQALSFVKKYKIISDGKIETTTELEVTSNIRPVLFVGTTYIKATDVAWYLTDGLGNINVDYSRYNISIGQQNYSLVEPGYYRMTKRTGRDYYDIDSSVKVGDGDSSFELGTSGHIERTVEAGEVEYRGVFGDGDTTQFYIDGAVTLAGGAACAALGGILGAGIPGGVAGAVICGGAVEKAQDAADIDTTDPSVRPPVKVSSGRNMDFGWLELKITVKDDTGISYWTHAEIDEEGNTRRRRHDPLIPYSKQDTHTIKLYNRECDEQDITIEVYANDRMGNLGIFVDSFTVDPKYCPSIFVTHPHNGEKNVLVDAVIWVLFCEEMDTIETTEDSFEVYRTRDGAHIDFTLDWLVGKGAKLHPVGPLDYSTEYTVKAKTTARAQDGDYLEEEYEFSFETEEPPEGQPHTVPFPVNTHPQDGQTGVPVNLEEIIIEFSEPIDTVKTTELEFSLIDKDRDTTILFSGIDWEEHDTVAVLSLDPPLNYDTEYQGIVGLGVTSKEGYAIENVYRWHFWTEGKPEEHVSVIKTHPTDGAKDVKVNIPYIKVNFSEPMDTGLTTQECFAFQPIIKFTLGWSTDNTVAYLNISGPLEYGTEYVGVVIDTATSAIGEHLESGGYVWSFTTEEEKAAEAEPVSVIGTNPPQDGIVPPDGQIIIVFSESVKEAEVLAALDINPATAEYEAFLQDNNEVLVIYPIGTWPIGITIKVIISSEKLNLKEDFVLVFTAAE